MASLRGAAAGPVPAPRAIVKLGGSLARDPALARWLAAIAEAPEPRLVVPGGGPFADAVRTLQPRLGFDDRVAHGAAILAMQQYALLLAAIEPRLILVEREDEIAEAARSRRSTIWLPWAMIGRDPALEASWRVTSDSLALLLAIRLAVPELLLVKSAALPEVAVELETLAERGVLDEAFAGLARGYRGTIRLAHAAEPETLARGGFEPERSDLPGGSAVATLREAG
ncbi:MAG: aspartate/glutamate/uridylate kinase [Geminicoccaceae bacterium]|nr:aspartate/glutamate/uridylate kinase [Geminicoccaceae bacterium]